MIKLEVLKFGFQDLEPTSSSYKMINLNITIGKPLPLTPIVSSYLLIQKSNGLEPRSRTYDIIRLSITTGKHLPFTTIVSFLLLI